VYAIHSSSAWLDNLPGHVLEDHDAPLSPTPVSLEDYVKHKPAGRNRGSKGWKPFDLFDGDFVPGLSHRSETTRLATLLQAKALSKDPVPVGQVLKSQPLSLMQNQTGLNGSVIFDYPPVTCIYSHLLVSRTNLHAERHRRRRLFSLWFTFQWRCLCLPVVFARFSVDSPWKDRS